MPANQIFYTHAMRPPKGISSIPPGLIEEMKKRNKPENDQKDNKGLKHDQTYNCDCQRKHEMKRMITKVRVFRLSSKDFFPPFSFFFFLHTLTFFSFFLSINTFLTLFQDFDLFILMAKLWNFFSDPAGMIVLLCCYSIWSGWVSNQSFRTLN